MKTGWWAYIEAVNADLKARGNEPPLTVDDCGYTIRMAYLNDVSIENAAKLIRTWRGV